MSKKILLDKISIPGIKTYEVYRKTVVTLQKKAMANDNGRRALKHLDLVVVVLVSCLIEMEFIDKNQENQDIWYVMPMNLNQERSKIDT
jgi:hypothetical protein